MKQYAFWADLSDLCTFTLVDANYKHNWLENSGETLTHKFNAPSYGVARRVKDILIKRTFHAEKSKKVQIKKVAVLFGNKLSFIDVQSVYHLKG